MSKKQYVVLSRGKRRYKLYAHDIINVHVLKKKKTPALPKFREIPDDGIPIEPKLGFFLA